MNTETKVWLYHLVDEYRKEQCEGSSKTGSAVGVKETGRPTCIVILHWQSFVTLYQHNAMNQNWIKFTLCLYRDSLTVLRTSIMPCEYLH